MISRSTLIGLILAALSGASLFYVKYQAIGLESELSKVHKDIFRTEEALHLLRAEWAYLNDPVRLQALACKHLKMEAATPLQMISLKTYDVDMKRGSNIKKPILIKWRNQP